jgi:hypothetical protein
MGDRGAQVLSVQKFAKGSDALADVQGTDVLPRRTLALMARALIARLDGTHDKIAVAI